MMKQQTIFLEATHDKNILKIGIYNSGDVIWRYEDLLVPLDKVRARTNEMVETLNQFSRKGGGGLQLQDRLKAFGRMLADELLTIQVKEKLNKTDAQFLILKIDDQLVHIPWELIYLEKEFLCQRFSMGRLVKTRQEISRCSKRNISRPLKMWILANPVGDLYQADAEGMKLFQDMADMNTNETIVAPSLDTEVSADDVRENIKAYDFIHYAGHVDYSENETQSSGWRLSDSHFTVVDVDKMSGNEPMPVLVFSNACQSARTTPWEWKENTQQPSFGLTNAFLRAGVQHYVGTAWEIMDDPSSYFSQEFYKILRSGGTTGEAVRQARINLLNQIGADSCWASYVLYGDPTVRYFRKERTETTAQAQPFEPVMRQNSITRGSILNYSVNSARFKDFQTWLVICLAILLAAAFIVSGIGIHQWNQNQKLQIASAERMKIQELMVTKALKQQERTHELFEKLNNLIAPLPVSETKTTDTPALVMVFDSQSMKNPRGKIILHALQDQIIRSQSVFKLLESESFDIVLEELVRKIELTPPQDRKRPNLLMPKLILIMEIYETEQSTLILMRIVDHHTRQVLDTEFHELDNKLKILEQKQELGNKVLQKLKKYEKS